MFVVFSEQILYCLVDQTLFGDEESLRRDSCSVVADLKRKHTSWKHVEGTHWHTRFSHLLNYGAGNTHCSLTMLNYKVCFLRN